MTIAERFWERVDKSGDCWLWTGTRDAKGYGFLSDGGRNFRAHRLSVELDGRSIGPGQIVMHTCDNPPCVRPEHLRVATQLENTRDMFAKGRQRCVGKSGRTVCPQGHPYSEENTGHRPDGRRYCMTCYPTGSHRRAIQTRCTGWGRGAEPCQNQARYEGHVTEGTWVYVCGRHTSGFSYLVKLATP